MKFFTALAWFGLVLAILRIVVIGVELSRVKNMIHYMLLEGEAKRAQFGAFVVAVVCVLWLVFGV